MPAKAKMFAAVLAASLLLCTAASAHADFPGERTSVDPRIAAELRIAVGYWAARGVTGCPAGIRVTVADDLTLPGGRYDPDVIGRGDDCQVWMLAGALAEWRAPGPGEWARIAAWEECTLVTHETGHALGLEHTRAGVMRPVDPELTDDCEQWGDAFRRPVRAAAARRGAQLHMRRATGRLRGTWA